MDSTERSDGGGAYKELEETSSEVASRNQTALPGMLDHGTILFMSHTLADTAEFVHLSEAASGSVMPTIARWGMQVIELASPNRSPSPSPNPDPNPNLSEVALGSAPTLARLGQQA